MEIIGFIGSLCLALCAAPQAYKSFKEKNSNGISLGFLILWSVGEILVLIYVIPMMSIPLLLNYISNIVFLSIIWYYKL